MALSGLFSLNSTTHIVQLKDFFLSDHIIDGLEAKNKTEALQTISFFASQFISGLEHEEIYQTILERENIGSTGIGNGIAIPHARFKAVERPVLMLFRSHDGVMFDAQDNKPVHLIFLVIAPEDASPLYLKLLARISKLIRIDKVYADIQAASTSQGVYQCILSADAEMGSF